MLNFGRNIIFGWKLKLMKLLLSVPKHLLDKEIARWSFFGEKKFQSKNISATKCLTKKLSIYILTVVVSIAHFVTILVMYIAIYHPSWSAPSMLDTPPCFCKCNFRRYSSLYYLYYYYYVLLYFYCTSFRGCSPSDHRCH